MRQSISIIAAMAVAPGVVMANDSSLTNQLQNQQEYQDRTRQRALKSGKSSSSSSSHDFWWGPPPHPGWHGDGYYKGHGGGWSSDSSSSSSGKSGKSGGGSGSSSKSGKGSSSSSSDDHSWLGGWHWGGHKPSGWSSSSSSSGKSGKGSKSSSSSSDDMKEGWYGGGSKPGHHHGGWWPKPSSSSSGKSGKSSKSSKSSKGSKGSSSSTSHDWFSPPGWGSHHDSSWDHDGWHGPWSGSWGGSSSSSGKSGKSGGSKSGKGSSGDHSHGHWHWVSKPWSSSSSSSKSGKSKSSKSKSSKGSSSSSSRDGYFFFHSHAHSSTSSPDDSSPGICAPSYDYGGLECDIDEDWEYCTEPGEDAECPSGQTCYDKELCPEFSTKDPIGVCDAYGKGLECDEVTTYCTEPGDHGECGSDRKCYDAGLCGFGKGKYDGVCGMALHGGKHSALDCDEVTTKCTEPGEHAECAYGAKCFDADLCHDGEHAGFCSKEHGFDCEDVSTYCDHPGEGGQCPHGQKCFDTKVCLPKLPPKTDEPTPSPDEHTPSPTVLLHAEVCFIEGEVVDCSEWAGLWGGDEWGSDGHGSGDGSGDAAWTGDGHGEGSGDGWTADGHGSKEDDDDEFGSSWYGDGHGASGNGSGDGKGYGEVITVPFTYTVDTDGKVKPESVIRPMEKAILDDVAEYVEDNEDYSHFTGKISAAPRDEIADDEWCGDGHAVRCSVVNGEMSVIVGGGEGWESDGHDFDECEALTVIKESMEGQDYSEDVDGVTGAKYRNSEVECEMIIGGAATVVPVEESDFSAAAAFAMLAAAAALIALAFLLLRKKKRTPPPEPVRDDISLISNSLNGSMYGDNYDPYANTVDVHKCTSIYCDCNKGGSDTTFLPAPKKVDMAQTMMANGISPTAVNEVDGAFFNQDDEDKLEHASDLEQQASQVSDESKGSIMRVPIRSQFEEEDRPLTPVNEIDHDSQIDTELEDTELESVAGENDETTIPPPPPLSFHPAYSQESGQVQMTDSNDEASI